MRVHWPAVALGSMAFGAVLLLRSVPLHPAWCLLPLLAWPWLRRQRASLLLACALGLWMAWSYQQQTLSRYLDEAHNYPLQGQVVGAVSQRDSGRHFAFVVTTPDSPLQGKTLRVAWYRDAEDVASGDCWQFELRVRPPHSYSNPGGMDYEAWLFREGYAGKASVRNGRLCGQAPPSLRQRIKQRLLHGRSGAAAATVSALLLGDRSDLTSSQWDILRRTGTSHLFAISGLHVGLIAAIGWGLGLLLWRAWLYRYVPRQRDLSALLAAGFALVYAALSGFAVPVQRALMMCLLGLLALQLGRKQQGFWILALAWVLVLAINPLSLMMPGLWLSFVAVAGIVLYLQAWPQQARWQQLLGIQLLLSVLLLPLSLLFFGGVSLLAAPINLLLVPLFSLLLPALLLVAGLQLLGWGWPLQLALQGLQWLWDGLGALAALPAGYISLSQPPWWLAALATAAVLQALGRGKAMAGLATALLLACAYNGVDKPAQGQLRAWFWDVGQGQSVLLQTAQHQLLYDAGPAWSGGFDAGERLVVPALQQLGIEQLDVLMVSHADNDHAGGASAVAQAFPLAQRRGAAGLACHAGQQWQWDGVQFDVLHPAQTQDWSDNNGSCVLQVTTAAGQRLLLTGDIEVAAEVALLGRGLATQSVISVPHHGSRSSSSLAFIQAVDARLAVVSAGFQSRWGHPAPAVVARYREQGTLLLNTAQSGALRLDLGRRARWSARRSAQPRLWRNFAIDSAP